MIELTRPILRYHGGKWLLAPWIISHFPAHRVYVEPFGGAGSVLLRKPRAYAEIYNDLDDEMVNLFRVVRDRSAEFHRAIELTPYARSEFVESYGRHTDPIEQARRTAARCCMGFGTNALTNATGFRASATRSGSTPAHDWRAYPDNIGAIMERMRGVCIENRPASQVIESHDSLETLIYADPPYAQETRDKGCDYNHEMTDDDHRQLATTLGNAAGMVVLSGYACPLYDDELYASWHRVERPALADGARPRTEVLWLNDAARDALDAQAAQSRMFA